jgi:hypothetical protein
MAFEEEAELSFSPIALWNSVNLERDHANNDVYFENEV